MRIVVEITIAPFFVEALAETVAKQVCTLGYQLAFCRPEGTTWADSTWVGEIVGVADPLPLREQIETICDFFDGVAKHSVYILDDLPPAHPGPRSRLATIAG